MTYVNFTDDFFLSVLKCIQRILSLQLAFHFTFISTVHGSHNALLIVHLTDLTKLDTTVLPNSFSLLQWKLALNGMLTVISYM